MHYVEFPFAQHIIEITKPGNFSITYGSLQDMCQTGAFFTNTIQNSITLNESSTGNDKISIYEDKCIIFTNPAENFHFLRLNGVNGRVILYGNGVPDREFTGTLLKYFMFDASSSPAIFRFYSFGEPSSMFISIQIESKMYRPKRQLVAFWNPNENNHCDKVEKCTIVKALKIKLVVIIVSILIGILAFMVFIYFVLMKSCCRRFKEKQRSDNNEWPTSKEKGQNRTEPTGTFLMDPILRTNADSY